MYCIILLDHYYCNVKAGVYSCSWLRWSGVLKGLQLMIIFIMLNFSMIWLMAWVVKIYSFILVLTWAYECLQSREQNHWAELEFDGIFSAPPVAAHSQSAPIPSQTKSSSSSHSLAERMRFGGKMASSKRGIVSLGMSGFCCLALLKAHLCRPFLSPTSSRGFNSCFAWDFHGWWASFLPACSWFCVWLCCSLCLHRIWVIHR